MKCETIGMLGKQKISSMIYALKEHLGGSIQKDGSRESSEESRTVVHVLRRKQCQQRQNTQAAGFIGKIVTRG